MCVFAGFTTFSFKCRLDSIFHSSDRLQKKLQWAHKWRLTKNHILALKDNVVHGMNYNKDYGFFVMYPSTPFAMPLAIRV